MWPGTAPIFLIYRIIIIIIIGTATHRDSWPPSEVFSILHDSWLLPTYSLFSASLRPFPTSNLHLARGLPKFKELTL
jgi:hypothetical protein